MFRKITTLLICMTLIISAAGCGGSSRTDSAAASPDAGDDTVQEAPADDETPDQKLMENAEATEAGADENGAAVADETAAMEVAEAADEAGAADAANEIGTAEETDTANAADETSGAAVQNSSGSAGDYDASYAYVNVKYDDSRLIITPNGTVNDSTVLYNGKTLGELCDYVDSTVLEEGRTINRKFLYGLVSTQIVDPQLMSSYNQFSNAMMYCLSIANEFYSIDVTLNSLILDSADNTKQLLNVTAEGKEDTWVMDGHEYKFYLNNGDTAYESNMFSPDTLAVWSVALDEVFEMNK